MNSRLFILSIFPTSFFFSFFCVRHVVNLFQTYLTYFDSVLQTHQYIRGDENRSMPSKQIIYAPDTKDAKEEVIKIKFIVTLKILKLDVM